MSTPPALDAYQWPPSNERISTEVGIDVRQIIRFDGNTPATPPASARPAALARALADINEYDRGRYEPLRRAIAELHGVGLDQISLGAGSDEFIVLVARIFAENGTIATVPSDSYSMYRYAALMAGATIVENVAQADLVFVCRPNNPTGELPEIPRGSRPTGDRRGLRPLRGRRRARACGERRDHPAYVLQGVRSRGCACGLRGRER